VEEAKKALSQHDDKIVSDATENMQSTISVDPALTEIRSVKAKLLSCKLTK